MPFAAPPRDAAAHGKVEEEVRQEKIALSGSSATGPAVVSSNLWSGMG